MQTSDEPILTERQRQVPELQWVDTYSRVLDTKFRIPGTGIRFGLDFILGLLPVGGDIVSLGMSGTLVATMARHGASPRLVARMLVNITLDAVVGSIPILGNLFDLVYKANYRNAVLMREYYEEGKHRGSVWPVVLAVIGVVVGLMVGLVWFLVWLIGLIF
jgi:hypothetical protein